MSAKIIAIATLVLLVLFAGSNYLNHKLSFAAGAKSRDAACETARAADKSTYQQAQTDAVAKAAAAQSEADHQQLQTLRAQMQEAQTQSLKSQQIADNATATANRLQVDYTRLKNEDKNVDAWTDACLPVALLASMHPGSNGKAPAGACR